MDSMTIEEFISRLCEDDKFQARFNQDRRAVCRESGLSVEDAERLESLDLNELAVLALDAGRASVTLESSTGMRGPGMPGHQGGMMAAKSSLTAKTGMRGPMKE